MQRILASSYIVRAFSAFFGLVGRKWRESVLITRYLRPNDEKRLYESALFARLFAAMRRALCLFFDKTGLTRAMASSVFRQPFLWCAIAAFIAPFVPTVVLICLCAVGLVTILARFGTTPELKLSYWPVNKFLLLYMAAYFAATFTSVTVSGSLYTGLLSILLASFSIVFDNAVESRRQCDLAVRLLVLSGTLVAAFGLYQYVFYSPTSLGAWIDSDMFTDITRRVYSTLENPNVLSEYLLLVIPFAAALVLVSKKAWHRLVFAVCFVAMVLCLLVTYSRGGYLGLLIAAAVFLVLIDARFILLGIVGLVALYFVLPSSVIARFASIGDMSDSSTSYRVYIWLGTLAMLKDYWLPGVGPGMAAFNQVYPAYSFNTVKAPHSHNLFLQTICEAGITGFVLFILMLLSFFRSTLSALAHEKDKASRILLIACVSSATGFLVQSMTDYTFYNHRVTLVFWIVLALGSVLSRRSRLEEGHPVWSRF
jgi:O-antigen ligase